MTELLGLQNNHTTPIDQLCEQFEVDPDKGLHYSEVNRRVQEHGVNKLSSPPKPNLCRVLFRSMLTMCMGLVIPLIFCIIIAALSQNLWITILTIILAIIIITSLIWSSYGEEKLMKPYLNRENVMTTQVLRDHNVELQELIVGYYRYLLKQSPVSDIIALIQEYYRMHISIFLRNNSAPINNNKSMWIIMLIHSQRNTNQCRRVGIGRYCNY